MIKSIWKCDNSSNFLYRLKKNILKKKSLNKIWYLKKKNLKIYDIFLNTKFKIYDGFLNIDLYIKDYMLNNKFGNYIFTKKSVIHKIYKRSNRKKKK